VVSLVTTAQPGENSSVASTTFGLKVMTTNKRCKDRFSLMVWDRNCNESFGMNCETFEFYGHAKYTSRQCD
jgi:hypothetical protein